MHPATLGSPVGENPLTYGIPAASARTITPIRFPLVTKVLLSLHVLAAIVAIGPVTVAASMFPAALRRGDRDAMRLLHRVCRVYALLGLAVPVLGLATAGSLGVLGDAWLIVSIALTAVAAAERQLRNARLLSLVPGVGGLLAERRLRTARPAV